jgi:UDP-N-acetylglucosamine 1-carboxyvinyltransferase
MAVAPALADAFVIEGSRRLGGTIRVAGNKNGALPILAASLIADGPVVLSNVPRIRDVDTMLELLADLGADATWTAANEVRVDATSASKSAPDQALCSKIRASFLLAGPLLARFGHVTMPPPGGDVIGRRRLDPHIHAFSELGADVDLGGRLYEIDGKTLRGADVFLDEASVMATENTVMAAVLTEGQTTLGNAACEPHVQDLCRFLVSIGAQIEGIESNVLRITGVKSLSGGEWSIAPDHIEVGSFIGMAAITGGDITIEGARAKDLVSIIPAFAKLGVRVELSGDSLHVPVRQQLIVQDDLGGMVPKIEDGPWPAFPSDLTSIAVTVATQAFGTVLMF